MYVTVHMYKCTCASGVRLRSGDFEVSILEDVVQG